MRVVPHGGLFGLLCLLGTVGLGAQAAYTYRRGYMYLGRAQKVYRTDRPVAFRVALLLHLGAVAFLAALTIINLLGTSP